MLSNVASWRVRERGEERPHCVLLAVRQWALFGQDELAELNRLRHFGVGWVFDVSVAGATQRVLRFGRLLGEKRLRPGRVLREQGRIDPQIEVDVRILLNCAPLSEGALR